MTDSPGKFAYAVRTKTTFAYLGIPFKQGGYLDSEEFIQHNTRKALATMNLLSSIGVNPSGFSKLLSTRFYAHIIHPQLEYGLAINRFTSSQVLPDVNCSTSFRVSSHDTTHRSTSPSIDENTTSITSNSDNQETIDWQESANTPVLADSVLNSNCFVATENENSTDDSASADMTRHNDADLLDLPGHQTSSTLLSRANASAEFDITASALLHMETSIHEVLALSHVLLLAPQ
ncbi:hypothetical protein G6F37_009534 [Rhizopus arrhizus]|nr:hypothetical protein G6F38_009656 [Rhizopus arrhizus]KAG1154347.1 hypothetical protein G6F37_009534 [Rhizopus arrhizus]